MLLTIKKYDCPKELWVKWIARKLCPRLIKIVRTKKSLGLVTSWFTWVLACTHTPEGTTLKSHRLRNRMRMINIRITVHGGTEAAIRKLISIHVSACKYGRQRQRENSIKRTENWIASGAENITGMPLQFSPGSMARWVRRGCDHKTRIEMAAITHIKFNGHFSHVQLPRADICDDLNENAPR